MIKMSVMLLLIAGLSGGLTIPADATTPNGPWCVSVAPFSNILVWFVDATALGNTWLATGRDLTTNQPQTVSFFISGGVARVGYMTYPSGGGSPIIGSGTINMATGKGPGTCYRLNSGEGCGTGTPVTFAFVTCPPGAASEASDGSATGGENLQ